MQPDDQKIALEFRRGLFLFLVVQTLFMAGGLLVERLLNAPVTGVPSMAGMTLILILSATRSHERGPYFLLGSFSLAFLAPAALYLVVRFKAYPCDERLVYYSTGYLSALVVAVWVYFGIRILKTGAP